VPVTIIHPPCSAEHGLEENLRSPFGQKYQEFEIVAGMDRSEAPPVNGVRPLNTEYPGVPTRITVSGDPGVQTAKCSVSNA
jgi:hypothetical protein